MFVPYSIKSYIPLFREYEVIVVGVVLVVILLYIVPESIGKTCHDMIMARTNVCP